MDDKSIMEDILMSIKGACGLYLHGTIESNTQNVRDAFQKALNESLTIQSDVYQKMASKGWYPTQAVEQQKIQDAKQKFANS